MFTECLWSVCVCRWRSLTNLCNELARWWICWSDHVLTTLAKPWLYLLNSHNTMTLWREDENWKKNLDVENRSLGMCRGQAISCLLTFFCCSLATTAHTFLPPWYSVLPMWKQGIQLSQAWDLWDYEHKYIFLPFKCLLLEPLTTVEKSHYRGVLQEQFHNMGFSE